VSRPRRGDGRMGTDERLALSWAWLSAGLTLAAVAALVGFLLARGLPVLGLDLLFGATPPLDAILGRRPVWEGIWPACAGTLSLVLLAGALAVPAGVACGIHLAVFARGRSRDLLRLGVDLLAGVPSILMGLFGFALILLLKRTVLPGANTSLFLAAGCIALLVLPYVASATAAALEGLPEPVRLLGPSLGLDPWQDVRAVLLPAAGRGILGGVILACGRAAEDTAVIMLTGAVAGAGLPAGIFGKFEALPFTIFYLAAQHQTPADLDRAWGAALALLACTTLLLAGARVMHHTLERRWKRVSRP